MKRTAKAGASIDPRVCVIAGLAIGALSLLRFLRRPHMTGLSSSPHLATSDTISGELARDFMFWPGRKHRFGWFLEHAYDYAFASGHQQSIGMSGRLLIASK